MQNDCEYLFLQGWHLSELLTFQRTFQRQLRVLVPGTNSSASRVLRHGSGEAAVALPASLVDYFSRPDFPIAVNRILSVSFLR